MKDFIKIEAELKRRLEGVRQELPDTMHAFHALSAAATHGGVLGTRFKELIALALAVDARCDGSVAHHARAAFKAGATREEVLETLGVVVMMGGSPAAAYSVEAFAAFEQFAKAEG